MFNTEILQRYLDVDVVHHDHWIVTMNRRKIHFITENCRVNNIYILPLSHHITPQQMAHHNILKDAYQSFIDEFERLIKELAPEDAYPDMYLLMQNMKRSSKVMQDILMGVSYQVIRNRYDVSINYIYKLASFINQFGNILPDRRNPDWQEQWEIQG